ncbi:MAG: hypothetical protein AB1696_11600 [Planctomycetota bacterium]
MEEVKTATDQGQKGPLSGGSLVGYVLQIVFSLKMIGSMFLIWVIINEAGCSQKNAKWVPYTGWELVATKSNYQMIAFPVLGAVFINTAVIGLRRIRRRTPHGYSIFAGLAKLLTANFLCIAGFFAGFEIFKTTNEGPGYKVGMAGAIGIGVIGLVAVLRRTLGRKRAKRTLPLPPLSDCKSLRVLGIIDYVFAGLLLLGGALVLGDGLLSGNDLAGKTYADVVATLFAISLIILGGGIRRGEGWAAMAHIISAAVICLMNAVFMIVQVGRFARPDAAVLIWSIFPMLSAIVFYILFVRARRDINWPIRFARCSMCGRAGVWWTNACETCGNSLKQLPETQSQEFCIYCRESRPMRRPVCRSCRKQGITKDSPVNR